MANGSSGNQGESFSTMGDDLLDKRFSSESIQIFHKSLADFESLLPVRAYDILVHFAGNFDTKSKNAIQNLVNESFVNAEKHQLKLERYNPEVSFHTRSSWETKSGSPLKQSTPLPAARISWNDGTPTVELIIPEKVTTSEEVIKTVRLLFSKLFGKLFFDEHVPGKTAFRGMVDDREPPAFDIQEKAHFIHFMDQFPPPLVKEFDRAAQKLGIKGPKPPEIGKNEFFNNLFNNQSGDENPFNEMIDGVFQNHLKSLGTDANSFYDDLTERFFALNPQTTIILPYDLGKFRSLSKNRQWTIFNALEERLQLIVNSMEEFAECRSYLEQASKNDPPEYAVLDAWKSTFSERIKILKRRGFVKPFLIEGAKLSQKQQETLDRFPLWIWQNCKPDLSSDVKKTGSYISRVKDQYKNSVYQKLFEAALRIYNCLDNIQSETYQSISDCTDFIRVKTILAWLDLRKTSYVDMLYTCKMGSQFGEVETIRSIGKGDALRNFEKGWSYFASFAMVHQYFLAIDKRSRERNDRSGPFFTLIENFVKARITSQPSFQISCLLIELYRRRKFKLSKVSELIRKESQILDFFILNQPDIFRDQSKSPAEIINHFAGSILEWQDKRDEQTIQQDELEAVRNPGS